MNRASIAALAAGCLLFGYALAGTRAGATAAEEHVARFLPNGVNPGDHIVLTFAVGSFGNSPSPADCTVAEVSSGWVRCSTEPKVTTRSGRPFAPPPGVVSQNDSTLWYDLMHVVMVQKVAK